MLLKSRTDSLRVATSHSPCLHITTIKSSSLRCGRSVPGSGGSGKASDWRPPEMRRMPAGSEHRPDSQAQSHWSEGQYNAGTHSLLALIWCLCMTACACVRAILDLKIAYFELILVKILAVVQSFQVANELCARHPLANVLKNEKYKFTFISQ